MAAGAFRDDLYARLNPWTFTLPGLASRREDIAPNLDYELDRFAEREGERVNFNKEARQRYLAFAASPEALRLGNFRDLAASVTRMATLSPRGRIDLQRVESEILRLKRLWSGASTQSDDWLVDLLGPDALADIDPFDRVQLTETIRICRSSRTLSEAGRYLFISIESEAQHRERCRPPAEISCSLRHRLGNHRGLRATDLRNSRL